MSFLCHICGNNHDYVDQTRLLAHIRKTERLTFVSPRTLAEWNIPRAEVDKKLAATAEGRMKQFGLAPSKPLARGFQKILGVRSKVSDAPEGAPVTVTGPVTVPDPDPDGPPNGGPWAAQPPEPIEDPKPAPESDPEPEPDSDSEPASEPPPEEEDRYFTHGFNSDGTTLDKYLEFIKEGREDEVESIDFHIRRLSRCISILTTGGYLVKQLSPSQNGKVIFTQMCKKTLSALLDLLTVGITVDPERGEKKDISLAMLLNKPRLCMKLDKFRTVDFKSDDPMIFNIWRGFAYEPEEDPSDLSLIQPFLAHIKEVICDNNEESYQHELKKLAWIFQNPNDHLGYATVLLGEEGCGKGTYTDLLCDLWGSDWAEPNITDMGMITESNHAETITWKKIVVANEIRDLEHNKASWEVMKSRITDEYYRVRNIYQPSKMVRNVNNYFFCTNNYSSIQMGQADRRYDIKEVSETHKQDTKYFSDLRRTFTSDMKSQLLGYFLSIDTKDFNSKIPPSSALKKEMQAAQKPLVQIFFENFDWRDSVGFDRREDGLLYRELYKDGFLAFCDEYGVPDRYRVSLQGFGMAIKKYIDQQTVDGDRRYYPKGSVEKNDIPPSVIMVKGEVCKKKKGPPRRSAPGPAPEPLPAAGSSAGSQRPRSPPGSELAEAVELAGSGHKPPVSAQE
jgi:hypothetical protein